MATEASQKLLNSFLVKAAIETVREQFPEKTLDQKTVQAVREKAESTMEEIAQIIHKIRKEGKKGEEAVSHLSPERISKIKKALDMKTYQININEKEKIAEFKRNGKDIYPAVSLISLENLKKATDFQIASVVIECIILFLDACGIEIPDDDKLIKKAAEIVMELLKRSNKLVLDVDYIKKHKDHKFEMAKGIVALVIDALHEGILWNIVHILISKMTFIQRGIAVAQAFTLFAAMIISDGASEIALIIRELVNATVLIEKLGNIETLDRMKLSLTTS